MIVRPGGTGRSSRAISARFATIAAEQVLLLLVSEASGSDPHDVEDG